MTPIVEEIKAQEVVIEEKKDIPLIMPEQKPAKITAFEAIELKEEVENPNQEV